MAIVALVLTAAVFAPARTGNAPFLTGCVGPYACTPCASVAASPNPASPANVGTTVVITASSTACPNPQYQFFTLAPGASSYTLARAYSTTATFSWNTTGLVAGTWRIGVWARDTASTGTFSTSLGTFDASTEVFYMLVNPNNCTAVGLSAGTPPQPSNAGTTVTFTATGTCPHASPSFQFFTLAPGAGAYTVAQAYSTSPTFIWNTTGLVSGTWTVAVWVRDAMSGGTYSNSFGTFDMSTGVQYTLTTTPCTAVGISGAPPSPSGVGTAVTFTATATCPHASPVFQFFTRAPGAGAWMVAQAYSASATFNWTTAGLVPGSWQVAVWDRDAQSTGVYSNSFGTFDLSTSMSYTLTTCASVGLSGAPPSSTGVGTPVLFTASSTGCPHASPLFQFFTLAPGASAYTVAQAFSTSNTFSWTTAGLKPGVWQVAVWVRDASSGGFYANSFGTFDASTSISYTLTSCTSVTLSAAPPNTAAHSTTVTFTASAMGCPNPAPLYEFWVLAPGASSWTLSQAYSAAAIFAWSAPATPGTYQVVVWAKDASSGGAASNSFGSWDVQASYTYTLT